MQVKLLILMSLSLLLTQATITQIPYAVFSGQYPTKHIEIGTLTPGQRLKITCTCPQSDADITFDLMYGADLAHLTSDSSSTAINIYTDVWQKAVPTQTPSYFWIEAIANTYYLQCQFKVELNGALIKYTPRNFFSDTYYAIHKISAMNSCKIRLNCNIRDLQQIWVYDLSGVKTKTNPVATTTLAQTIVTLPAAGDYFIVIKALMPTTIIPYTLTVTTLCQKYCVDPKFPNYAPPCSSCGDGILDPGEECDNRNRQGCSKCRIVSGYACTGGLGSSSSCMKIPVCGDGVVDQGEQCDNGNKTGCALNCVPDAGYNCSAVLGSKSVCASCGNGILEPGEDCDNKNGVGCSSKCKIDPGYACRGAYTSYCFRSNPVCGNKVIEIGEGCDDGNKVANDGCGINCIVQAGYACSGELGASSSCSKKQGIPPVCGNGIFQQSSGATVQEKCDNGNRLGCFGCVVLSGWECFNRIGFASVCSPKVVAPHCGNGIFEPLQDEACEDGNTFNGDGCSGFCRVEYNWVCIDNKRCLYILDPANQNYLKTFCGNGKLETAYGEECDDGNKFNGDGCNPFCKVESGWDCRVYNLAQSRSYCSRRSYGYCGNGVVDWTEACDDGFPVKNGDGCNIRCQVETGWYCTDPNLQQGLSRCWKV